MNLLKFPEIDRDSACLEVVLDALRGDSHDMQIKLLTEIYNYYSSFEEDIYTFQIAVKVNELIGWLEAFHLEKP